MPPRKVYTPGSKPPKVGISPGRGRPKKASSIDKSRIRKGNYRTRYDQEMLKRAVQEVVDKTMSFGEAAKHYGVPKTTIHDRVKETVGEKLGRPTELSSEEEAIIVERCLLLGEWGYPLSHHDLTHLIKAYLDSLGRTSRFVNNLPGPDFVRGFLARHKELTVRTANLIKRSRAALSQEIVNSFFDLYQESATDIPPSNVFNYDETNLRDNPGKCEKMYLPTYLPVRRVTYLPTVPLPTST